MDCRSKERLQPISSSLRKPGPNVRHRQQESREQEQFIRPVPRCFVVTGRRNLK
jgi:hypothetical protein